MTTDDSGAKYVLTALLPRLEKAMPGLLDELVAGINADKKAIKTSGKMTPELKKTFNSAANILGRADV